MRIRISRRQQLWQQTAAGGSTRPPCLAASASGLAGPQKQPAACCSRGRQTCSGDCDHCCRHRREDVGSCLPVPPWISVLAKFRIAGFVSIHRSCPEVDTRVSQTDELVTQQPELPACCCMFLGTTESAVVYSKFQQLKCCTVHTVTCIPQLASSHAAGDTLACTLPPSRRTLQQSHHHLACCVSQCIVMSMLFCRFALTEYTATSRSLRPCDTSACSCVICVPDSSAT